MESRREHERVLLSFYLRIFVNETFAGFIVDVSKDGFMMMSEFGMDIGKLYDFKMKIPTAIDWVERNMKGEFVKFSAMCKWSKPDDSDKNFHQSGFTFTQISDSTNEIIHEIVKRYKFLKEDNDEQKA